MPSRKGKQDIAVVGDPLRAGEFQHHLFVQAPGMPVLDVLHGRLLPELGALKQPLKPEILPVGLLILNQKS